MLRENNYLLTLGCRWVEYGDLTNRERGDLLCQRGSNVALADTFKLNHVMKQI